MRIATKNSNSRDSVFNFDKTDVFPNTMQNPRKPYHGNNWETLSLSLSKTQQVGAADY